MELSSDSDSRGLINPPQLVFERKSTVPRLFRNAAFWLVGQTDRQTHKHFLFGRPFLSEKGMIFLHHRIMRNKRSESLKHWSQFCKSSWMKSTMSIISSLLDPSDELHEIYFRYWLAPTYFIHSSLGIIGSVIGNQSFEWTKKMLFQNSSFQRAE